MTNATQPPPLLTEKTHLHSAHMIVWVKMQWLNSTLKKEILWLNKWNSDTVIYYTLWLVLVIYFNREPASHPEWCGKYCGFKEPDIMCVKVFFMLVYHNQYLENGNISKYCSCANRPRLSASDKDILSHNLCNAKKMFFCDIATTLT